MVSYSYWNHCLFMDRLVFSLINKRMVTEKDFVIKENDAVVMTEEGRRRFLEAWQNKKTEIIKHPFLEEKVEWGMIPFTQSLLLARHIRGDIDEYPVFLWK